MEWRSLCITLLALLNILRCFSLLNLTTIFSLRSVVTTEGKINMYSDDDHRTKRALKCGKYRILSRSWFFFSQLPSS